VFLRADGALGFDCKHNSCQDRHWHDLRVLVDGDRERRRYSGHGSPGANRTPEDAEWPQPQPLPEGLPPVMPFDYEMLPPVLHRRVADIAERMQCPADFPAVALMVALSSLVGRPCGIEPKRADDWTVIPNLRGKLIGRPGIMKSPPLKEATRPLEVLQARAIAHFKHQDTWHFYVQDLRLTRRICSNSLCLRDHHLKSPGNLPRRTKCVTSEITRIGVFGKLRIKFLKPSPVVDSN
jgi:hypothetical protein